MHITKIRFFTVLLSLGLLTGCVTTRVPLDKETSAKITSVETRLIIPADEIIVRANPSNLAAASGGGLLFALIDSAVSKSRQTELEAIANPFYDKVDSIDFRTLFSDAFIATISDQKSLQGLTTSVSTRGLSKVALDAKRAKLNPGEAFLGLRIRYEFTLDLRSVIVVADTGLVTKDKPDFTYKNSLLYLSKPMEGANPLDAWSANNGQALVEALTEGAKEIARMLKRDLDAPSNELIFAEFSKQAKSRVEIPTYPILSSNGFLVEENTLRKTVRAESGALYSVPK